jgi:hypothetical protein
VLIRRKLDVLWRDCPPEEGYSAITHVEDDTEAHGRRVTFNDELSVECW